MDNDFIVNKLMNKYNLEEESKEELLHIIKPIIANDEFQKRMQEPFLHHGTISLGEHIIEDSIVTYNLVKKKNKKKYNNINLDLALKISMFHDLYTEPWQNNIKTKRFTNKHGFRHPIEAVVNAFTWYPELFNNKVDNKIVIDGILHHMYPLPVSSRKNFNNNLYEINNYDYYNKLPLEKKEIISNSLQRHKIGYISFSRSLYKEGLIMSRADRYVSIHQIKGLSNTIALITGRNKRLNNNKTTKK